MIINGDSVEALKKFEDNSIDAVITDPPYGIEFLGKEWDKNTGAIDIWRECLRVLKPGGFLLAFSAARTYHHLATNIEQVGFEIRDQIMWIYASGFPKAQDIGKAIQRRQGVEAYEYRDKTDGYNLKNEKGFTENNDVGYGKMKGIAVPTSPEAKQWAGWKTALKPAHEPIVMARKPMKGSTIDNVLEHGVGALNIDATRIAFPDRKTQQQYAKQRIANSNQPANPRKTTYGSFADKDGIRIEDKHQAPEISEIGRYPSNVVGEIADHQKYFYCPKVSRRERHRGFEQDQIPNPLAHIENETADRGIKGDFYSNNIADYGHNTKKTNVGNNHPTVKPVALMKYLIKLVTPPGSHIIDPFSGSGSTGMACKELGRQFTGIDLDENYCEIARRRIAATQENKTETLFEEQT